MRWLLVLLVACGPKVSTAPSAFDEDLPRTPAAEAPPAPTPPPPRPIAPPGKGLRTGSIPRARLNAVLDAGPAAFLRQIEIDAKLDHNRFVGWQLVQLLDPKSPLVDVDVVPGDVLLAINGKPIARPDQFQQLWDSLRSANQLTAQLWRGDAQLTLAFTIDP
jgi:hypothetical protein